EGRSFDASLAPIPFGQGRDVCAAVTKSDMHCQHQTPARTLPCMVEESEKAWLAAFEALPEDRKGEMDAWFRRQSLVIEGLGIAPEHWFGYVQWAIENLFDW